MTIRSVNQEPPSVINRSHVKANKEASTKDAPVQATPVLNSATTSNDKLLIIAKRFGLTSTSKKDVTVEQRAERRKRINAARKQQNLESILDFAQGYTDNANIAEDVDPDWLYAFFMMAEEIFSNHMQALWGKILAAQVSRPGAFSMKSLHVLKQMTMKEAIAFQHALTLTCKDRNEYGGRIISGYYKPTSLLSFFTHAKPHVVNLSQHGVNYPDLLTLIDLNLIYAAEIETGKLPIGHVMHLDVQQKKMQIRSKVQGGVLIYYKLTQTGNELAKLMKVESRDSYFSALKELLAPVFDLTL
ncbi:TIGR03899 family protein [Algibacillus agarilyticus]|uniref:TIGR03899 family protein n=1 Tax=Algibacillus agarilyticus TaxID=2234133 RepID=UPI001300316F|nr:TIGR03899 family protein [Algibacillus agarilyticus]